VVHEGLNVVEELEREPMTSTAMVVRANSPRIAGNLVPDFQPQFIAY
jgi:hypothetical protein